MLELSSSIYRINLSMLNLEHTHTRGYTVQFKINLKRKKRNQFGICVYWLRFMEFHLFNLNMGNWPTFFFVSVYKRTSRIEMVMLIKIFSSVHRKRIVTNSSGTYTYTDIRTHTVICIHMQFFFYFIKKKRVNKRMNHKRKKNWLNAFFWII